MAQRSPGGCPTNTRPRLNAANRVEVATQRRETQRPRSAGLTTTTRYRGGWSPEPGGRCRQLEQALLQACRHPGDQAEQLGQQPDLNTRPRDQRGHCAGAWCGQANTIGTVLDGCPDGHQTANAHLRTRIGRGQERARHPSIPIPLRTRPNPHNPLLAKGRQSKAPAGLITGKAWFEEPTAPGRELSKASAQHRRPSRTGRSGAGGNWRTAFRVGAGARRGGLGSLRRVVVLRGSAPVWLV
jgi:hypothetical protein